MESKRAEYLNRLYSILDLPDDKEMQDLFINTYMEYTKFCYDYNFSSYDYELANKTKHLFIIESTPLEYHIDNDLKEQALNRLKCAIDNIKRGIPDGISIDDAKLILEANIQNARIGLAHDAKKWYNEELDNTSLRGFCGFSQALTVYPLQELGLNLTINNTGELPDSKFAHAFATCTLPIKEGNKVYEKQFLLDATYRQFFLTIECNGGCYYFGIDETKDQTSPRPGYYVCRTEEGRAFARELLKKGYIELTEENARIYGSGFSNESICFNTPYEERERIINHSGQEYIDAIKDEVLEQELDYTPEELNEHNLSLYNNIGNITYEGIKTL